MFCKWCGNTIKTTDKKCSSCGRETPPLSDCGGFYDLKRPWEGAALPSDSAPATGAPGGPDPELMRLREETKAIRKEANDRHKIMLIICGVLAAALIVVLILYIVAVSGDDPAPQIVPQGGGQVVSTEGTGGPETPTGPGDPTGTTGPAESIPTETTEPAETEPKPFAADITLLTAEDGKTITASVDGVDENCCEITDGSRKLPKNVKGLDIAIFRKNEAEPGTNPVEPVAPGQEAPDSDNAGKAALNVQWHNKFEQAISMVFSLSDMADFENVDIEYAWEWAKVTDQPTGEALEWKQIGEQNELPRENVPTKMQISDVDTIQLRCTVTATNADGETVTVQLGGFRVDLETFNITLPEKQEIDPENIGV